MARISSFVRRKGPAALFMSSFVFVHLSHLSISLILVMMDEEWRSGFFMALTISSYSVMKK